MYKFIIILLCILFVSESYSQRRVRGRDFTVSAEDTIKSIVFGSGNVFNVTKYGSTPVIQGSSDDSLQSYPPSVIVYRDTSFAIVKSNHKLWGYYSLDGITWVDNGEVMNSGFNSWGVGVSESGLSYDPDTELFHLFYTANYGPTSYDSSAIGHATSTRPLSGYVADPDNPIMRPETINDLFGTGYQYTSVGDVVKVGSTYIYYFAMRENNLGDNAFSSIFCATSDSLNGSPTFKNFIFHGTILPNRTGNSLFTPSVVKHNDIFYMMFYNGHWLDETVIHNDEGDLFLAYGGPYEFKPIQTPFLENSTVDQSWDERRVYMAKFLKEQDGTWLTPKKTDGKYRIYFSGFGENTDINHGYTGLAEFTQFPTPYGIGATDNIGGLQSNNTIFKINSTSGVDLFKLGGSQYSDTLFITYHDYESGEIAQLHKRNGYTKFYMYGPADTSLGFISWDFGGLNVFTAWSDNTNEFRLNHGVDMDTEFSFGYKDSTYIFKGIKSSGLFQTSGGIDAGDNIRIVKDEDWRGILVGESLTKYASYNWRNALERVELFTAGYAYPMLFNNLLYLSTAANGLVGINTASPNEELSIYAATYPYIQITNSTTGTAATDGSHIGVGGATRDLQIINKESAKIDFFTANISRFVISSTGMNGTPAQSVTLGAGSTTFATTSNVINLTGNGGGNTLATITGGINGGVLTIMFNDALITITDTDAHTANTIDLSAAFTSADDKILQLVYIASSWYEVSRSTN